jgi:hypothetical protein
MVTQVQENATLINFLNAIASNATVINALNAIMSNATVLNALNAIMGNATIINLLNAMASNATLINTILDDYSGIENDFSTIAGDISTSQSAINAYTESELNGAISVINGETDYDYGLAAATLASMQSKLDTIIANMSYSISVNNTDLLTNLTAQLNTLTTQIYTFVNNSETDILGNMTQEMIANTGYYQSIELSLGQINTSIQANYTCLNNSFALVTGMLNNLYTIDEGILGNVTALPGNISAQFAGLTGLTTSEYLLLQQSITDMNLSLYNAILAGGSGNQSLVLETLITLTNSSQSAFNLTGTELLTVETALTLIQQQLLHLNFTSNGSTFLPSNESGLVFEIGNGYIIVGFNTTYATPSTPVHVVAPVKDLAVVVVYGIVILVVGIGIFAVVVIGIRASKSIGKLRAAPVSKSAQKWAANPRNYSYTSHKITPHR